MPGPSRMTGTRVGYQTVPGSPHRGAPHEEKLLDRGEISHSDKVVVISTAHGLKFTDFKIRYHQDELAAFGVKPERPNLPIELPADYDKVRDALFRELESAAWLTPAGPSYIFEI